jgi:hypothetical protein
MQYRLVGMCVCLLAYALYMYVFETQVHKLLRAVSIRQCVCVYVCICSMYVCVYTGFQYYVFLYKYM